MKLFFIISLFLLSSCATSKVSSPKPVVQVIHEKNEKETAILIMTERVFNFAPNSSELDPDDKETLSIIIQEVVKEQDKYNRIEIVGHSDQTGTENSNLEVSKDRAIAILEMMKAAGIDRKKIRTSWLAGTEPMAAAKDSSLNRRVEIKFFKEKKIPLTTTN